MIWQGQSREMGYIKAGENWTEKGWLHLFVDVCRRLSCAFSHVLALREFSVAWSLSLAM